MTITSRTSGAGAERDSDAPRPRCTNDLIDTPCSS